MTDSASSAYAQLITRSKETSLLASISSLTGWDQQTYLPKQGGLYRAEQSATLAALTHRQFTAPKVGDWLSACEESGSNVDPTEAANLRQLRHHYDRSTKLPESLVESLSRERSLGHEAWTAARSASDFSIFKPNLARLIDLTRQQADLWGYEVHPYDALLDEYEQGATTAQISELFTTLTPQLSELVTQGVARTDSLRPSLPPGPYPIAMQQRFNRRVSEAFGFDFARGRIDTTTHPFCTTLGPDDIRLTTRYDEADFTSSLYGVLHETGHGLYEQGLPTTHFGTPAGSAISLGIHESQSRLWENHIGRTLAFWEHWYPLACECFPQLKDSSPQQLTDFVNRVQRTFIRVEADEVCYDLHIILRFEVELGLFNGDLTVDEVPEFWNERFKALFGMTVPDDANGCLQDVHWSGAAFGYFPTYTLGNLNAAQLIAKAHEEMPNLDTTLADGQYGDLLQWLQTRVHAHGSCLLPQDLIEAATGTPTRAQFHLAHLRAITTGGAAE